MNDFLGFLVSGAGTIFPLGLIDLTTGLPATPDANPVARVYGQNGFVTAGDVTLTPAESGTITGATFAAPITVTFGAITTLTAGTCIWVQGVLTNTAANGLHTISVLSTTTADLIGTVGNGAYGGGGTWMTAGLYSLDLTQASVPTLVANLEEGQNYAVDVTWTQSAAPRKMTFTFNVG